MHVDDLGVVRLTWAHGVEITQDAAEQSARAVEELVAGGPPRPLCVDMTGTSTITRSARRYFTTPMPWVSRLALLGRSAVDRVVANFALGVSGTPPSVDLARTDPAGYLHALAASSAAAALTDAAGLGGFTWVLRRVG